MPGLLLCILKSNQLLIHALGSALEGSTMLEWLCRYRMGTILCVSVPYELGAARGAQARIEQISLSPSSAGRSACNQWSLQDLDCSFRWYSNSIVQDFICLRTYSTECNGMVNRDLQRSKRPH